MSIEIGEIEAIFRYPVKSMRGESLPTATLGWHGLAGDRRLALRRLDDRGGFPWLTASKLPDLILFTPERRTAGHGAHGDANGGYGDPGNDGHDAAANGEALPTHVRTPEGEPMPAFGEALSAEISRRHGAPVQMMHLNHGIFDDANISVITSATADEICRLAGSPPDVRRFRPNIVIRTTRPTAFTEDEWLGGVLTFGTTPDAPAVAATMPDIRCAMINLDPNGAGATPEVLKAVVRTNQNKAGVYGTITRTGHLAVGQTVVLHR